MHNLLTLQEAFDRIVLHLGAQGGPAITDGGRCVYRAENGDRCAVGVLIPESAFDEWECMKQDQGFELCAEDIDGAVSDLYEEHRYLLHKARIDTNLVDGPQEAQNMYDFLEMAQTIHDKGHLDGHACEACAATGNHINDTDETREAMVASWPLWYDALGRWFGLNTESVEIAFGTVKVPDLTMTGANA